MNEWGYLSTIRSSIGALITALIVGSSHISERHVTSEQYILITYLVVYTHFNTHTRSFSTRHNHVHHFTHYMGFPVLWQFIA